MRLSQEFRRRLPALGEQVSIKLTNIHHATTRSGSSIQTLEAPVEGIS
jgi:hypothetical protein